MQISTSKHLAIGMHLVAGVLIILIAIAVAFDIRLLLTDKNKSEIVLYQGSTLVEEAKDRFVTVNGQQVFLYNSAVNLNRSWSRDPKLDSTPVGYFDFIGEVEIKVKVPEIDIKTVTIRPISLGIKPKIKGDTISFKLDKPAKLTIEVNDKIERAIHLFANAKELNAPKEGDPNVHYFGPGVHKVGKIAVKSNEIVYIAGGAVVYGCIKAEKLENVKIMGHGILSGSIYDRWQDTMVPMDLRECKNVSVEGITCLDPSAWTLNVYKCNDVQINDVNIISARSNSDGISVQSCNNFVASNCFVRSWDDSLVVKGYDADSKGVTFDNCIVWTDLAQSCEIGYETRANTIEDITFKNITVLHNFHKPVLSIHNSDNAMIKNIYYDNIVVEDAQMGQGDAAGNNYLIDIMIDYSSNWSKAKTRGNVRDVFYNNIKVLSGILPVSRIYGYDEEHTIENVSIKNINIFDKAVTDIKSGNFYINEFTKNITF